MNTNNLYKNKGQTGLACLSFRFLIILSFITSIFSVYSASTPSIIKDVSVKEYTTSSMIEITLSSLKDISYTHEFAPNNTLILKLSNVSLDNFSLPPNVSTKLIKSIWINKGSHNNLNMEILLTASNVEPSIETDNDKNKIYITIGESTNDKPTEDDKSKESEPLQETNITTEQTKLESTVSSQEFSEEELQKVSEKIKIDNAALDKILFLKEVLKASNLKDYEKAYDILSTYIKNYNDKETLKYCLYLLADTHYKIQSFNDEKDLNKTINLYRTAVESYPDSTLSPWALVRIIQCYKELKQDSDAIKNSEELITNYPDSHYVPLAMLIKAEIIAKENKLPDAFGICNTVKEKYKGTIWEIEAGYYIGDFYYFQSEWLNAYNQYKKMLDINKQLARKDADRFYRIGDTFFINENWEKAREILIFQYKEYPNYKKSDMVLTHIGDTYREEGDKLRSLRYYQKVVIECPDTEGALASMVRLADAGFQDSMDGTIDDKLYYDAYKNPIETYKKIAVNKKSPEISQVALFKLGEAYSKSGDYLGSIAALDALIKKFSDTPLADNARQIIISIMKEAVNKAYEKENYFLITEYFSSYATIRYEKLKDPDFIEKVANAYYQMKFYPEALKLYSDLFELSPDKTDTLYYKWIKCLFESGDVDKALEEAEKFKIYNSQYENITAIYHLLGDIYRTKSNLFRSIKYYEMCFDETEPFEAALETRINIARNYMDMNQSDKAIEAYNEALLLFEKQKLEYSKSRYVAEILFNLGESLFELKDYQKALRAYKEFLTIFPDDNRKFMTNYKIGKIYLQLNNYTEAKIYFALLYDQNEDDFWKRVGYNALDELKLQEKYSYVYDR